ncbi:MAG: hypothetical protein ACLP6G_03520 [Terriglobales bacterium]
MTNLDLKDAFFHVIDGHRWLAASGCAWNMVGWSGPKKGQFDGDLPNIDVMILNSLLLHARSLIKFYRGGKGPSTDIVLSNFTTSKMPGSIATALERYEHPIEIHLLHLTDFRDTDYRKSHPVTGRKKTSYRPDWNHEAAKIVELILNCLKCVSEQGGRWQTPFKALYGATASRYRDKSYEWPKELCEKSDFEKYVTALGP